MADAASLALWALITGGTPLVLASVPLLRTKISDRTLHLMLGFSAGLLGGLATLEIIPESFRAAEGSNFPQSVPLGMALGFFALLLVERHLVGRGGQGHVHYENGRAIQPFGTLALSALSVHGLVDGFVIPLGFELGAEIGMIIVVAVAVHQIPDSVAALAVGLASTATRRRAALFVVLTAIDTPIGIALGALFLGVGKDWIAAALAFSAGTFLFVSAADLIPELQHRSRSLLVTLSIVLGFAVILAVAFAFPV